MCDRDTTGSAEPLWLWRSSMFSSASTFPWCALWHAYHIIQAPDNNTYHHQLLLCGKRMCNACSPAGMVFI